jgi:tetratricopeptide (TPR) repeat protein
MQCQEESLLAAKRVFSYNPSSKLMLDMFPEYAPIIEEISDLVDKYGQRLREDANSWDAWALLGYCYLTLGDFPNSFAAFAHAIKTVTDNRDPVFWYAAGIVYSHYKYAEHGLSCLQKVIDCNPRFQFASDVLLRIAFVQRSVENYQAALEFFYRVIRNPPNGLVQDDIQFQVAYTLQLQGSTDRAVQIYRDLRARYPKCERLAAQYCWFMYLQNKDGNLDAVEKTTYEAIKASPSDPTLLLIA